MYTPNIQPFLKFICVWEKDVKHALLSFSHRQAGRQTRETLSASSSLSGQKNPEYYRILNDCHTLMNDNWQIWEISKDRKSW